MVPNRQLHLPILSMMLYQALQLGNQLPYCMHSFTPNSLIQKHLRIIEIFLQSVRVNMFADPVLDNYLSAFRPYQL